ncbi:MAG TPA: hypothetical protein VMH27_20990 [Puia sp.]|nr:hypothetical protein [Puia sp.]
MKRRKFVFLSIAGGLATVTPFCRSPKPTLSALNNPQFLSTICDVPTIRKIGADYRATNPAEDRESRLSDLLTADLDANKDRTEQITGKIRADFAAGRTVTLEGWVISLTEARQCALNSIQMP